MTRIKLTAAQLSNLDAGILKKFFEASMEAVLSERMAGTHQREGLELNFEEAETALRRLQERRKRAVTIQHLVNALPRNAWAKDLAEIAKKHTRQKNRPFEMRLVENGK
ncbi:MAG TPA: hypothetical protein VFX17_00070 [Patescibacteria group bacterium]|nr:hypothetical protein [Patescibacteria group bacterium]